MKKLLPLLSLLFFLSIGSFAQDCTIGTTVGSMCTFNTDGVLTIPAGVELLIDVKSWGAGGGSQTAKNKRCGGGGGAYFTANYSVSAGSTFPITVGQGAVSAAGGDTSFDFGGGLVIVGGGGLGTTSIGLGGIGAVPGGDGGLRETGGASLDAGGGGGGSGPGNGAGGTGGNPVDGVGGVGGVAGSAGAAGGAGGNDVTIGSTAGVDGAFPGGGAGGKGTTAGIEDGAAGGNGQVIICVTAVILPVELVAFNGNVENDQIRLEWQTASEQNNNGFEIQKSIDGRFWDQLDFVEGNGTTLVPNKYTSIDQSPIGGMNYYRLKQMDFNGNFEFSNVISVDFNRLKEITAYPNPVNDQLIIKAQLSKEVDIQIYNTLGQSVYQNTQFLNSQLGLDLSDLKTGTYYLNIDNAETGGSIFRQHLIKNNSK